ncbi:SDR family oxidoreductase [Pedobacter antarcticus]|uniref:SDR family oxidoreductase n=1 Tax=Pedobacter antarcticus TaxID=34086 RepID=UPI001C59D04B|nr:SDR family oxidoreductase [Pedobacter antarcticus]
MSSNTKTISVLGCGWFGFPFAVSMVKKGYTVKGSTTTPEKKTALQEAGIAPYLLDLNAEIPDMNPEFFNSDILICCIPPKRDPVIQQQYAEKIKRIADSAAKGSIRDFIFISSTSVFRDNNQQLNEDDAPVPDTASGKIILEAEQNSSSSGYFRTTIVRFAGLFGTGRDPGRFFAGKTDIANGLSPVNMIGLEDCIGIITSIISQEKYGGIYHACSPEHPDRMSFYTAAAKRSGLPLPQFIPQKNSWKIIESNRLKSELDYKFQINLHDLVSQ